MAMVMERFQIFPVQLDPATGAETAKTRPCVVVSPDELNRAISTVIIAPMTTVQRGWPTRVAVTFQGKTGEIALDQIRAVDKARLVRHLGKLDAATADAVLDTLPNQFHLGMDDRDKRI
jgi:mRNA interferase MazF